MRRTCSRNIIITVNGTSAMHIGANQSRVPNQEAGANAATSNNAAITVVITAMWPVTLPAYAARRTGDMRGARDVYGVHTSELGIPASSQNVVTARTKMPRASTPHTRPTITVARKLARLITAWSQMTQKPFDNSRRASRSRGQVAVAEAGDAMVCAAEFTMDLPRKVRRFLAARSEERRVGKEGRSGW